MGCWYNQLTRYISLSQIKALVPNTQQYHLPIRTSLLALQCLLRRQHVTQIPLWRPSTDTRVYHPFRTEPWYPVSITWPLTAQLRIHTERLTACFIQQCHRFLHALPMGLSAKQIVSYQWARLSVIRGMGSKEITTCLHMRLQRILVEYHEIVIKMIRCWDGKALNKYS